MPYAPTTLTFRCPWQQKKGIDAQFSIDEEKVAFIIQEELGEKDYPIIYVKPHPKTMSALKDHTDVLEMYKYYLPEHL
ncbi:hypothetical protein EV207_12469 [Scopulibacillus darangshiensis]|uniref:Uncharacterized protein n=1 Tax=Scopulibacillus darangshiensis TaxID=442528 RepID=A0A4R2NRT2_9BACL|nr:hypothetical protein [Scopulibacillus darangshiensis]TCP24570.1 hypothetical protein EV207_12469 [Scopulibacillus darangshiensis]